MAKRILDKRLEAEAAEAQAKTKKKTTKKKAAKKKAAKKKTTTRARKKKADTPTRRRLVWVVYSSTMREEGRYLYHERDQAEEKLKTLMAKGKRRYFIQPIKEPLDSEGNPMVPDDEKPVVKKVAAPEPEAETETEDSAEAPAADSE